MSNQGRARPASPAGTPPSRLLAPALALVLLAACNRGGDARIGVDAGEMDAAVETGSGVDAAGDLTTTDGAEPLDASLPPLSSLAWVYAGGSTRIDLFAADLRSGALSRRATVAAGDDARLAELDPRHPRVYVQSQAGLPYAVLPFEIRRSDGALLPGPVHTLPVQSVEGVTQMQIHPTAPWFMLSASNQNPGLEDRLMPLDSSGALGEHRTISYLFYGFTWDPSGRFFYGLDGEAIFQYAFDAGRGSITPFNPPQAVGSAGRVVLALRTHPTGKWVFSIEEAEIGVYAFEEREGPLFVRSYVQSPLPEEPTYWTSALVHPNGRFLYALGYLTDSKAAIVDLFNIDPGSGALSFVARQGASRDGQRQVQNTGLQGPLLIGDLLIMGGPRMPAGVPTGAADFDGEPALVVYRAAQADGRLEPVGAPVPLSPAPRSSVSFLFSVAPAP